MIKLKKINLTTYYIKSIIKLSIFLHLLQYTRQAS